MKKWMDISLKRTLRFLKNASRVVWNVNHQINVWNVIQRMDFYLLNLMIIRRVIVK
jgi:hypothetical protein